jgi:predicted NUDIX family phosphoesterase
MGAKSLKEHVLCFPSSLLDTLGRFQGVSFDVATYFPHVTAQPNCRYVLRQKAEADPTYKQLVPYVVILCGESLFCYRRGKWGGEERLHALYSVGVGGHIAVEDRMLFSTDPVGYEDAMWRELGEEITIPHPHREACVALINDDSNSVGKVHFGVVHVIETTVPTATKKQSSITDVGYVSTDNPLADRPSYETWSRLLLERVDDLLARARALWNGKPWCE